MTFRKKNVRSLHKHHVQDNCICCIVICCPCSSCSFCLHNLFKNLFISDSSTFKVSPSLISPSLISPSYFPDKSLIQKYNGKIWAWNNTHI